MTSDLTRLVQVQGALWAFYALVPWLALRRWLAGKTWPIGWAFSVLAGVCSQAILGSLWGLFARYPARGEAVVYLGVWLLAAIWLRLRQPSADPDAHSEPLPIWEHLGLGAVLLAGGILRLIHPLRTWALGQSDAYSHLAMFGEVVREGTLANAAYPPGYAWIIAMPAAALHLDPYYLARFGGAFLGVSLALAVYLFLTTACRARAAALAGAFFVACFPGLALLIKTGVGCFANQVGLFLVPAIFAGILIAKQRPGQVRSYAVVMGAVVGLAVTVPMMLLHVALVAGLFLWLDEWARGRWWLRKLWRWRWVWVPLSLLAAFVLVRSESGVLARMVVVFTTADETAGAYVPPDTFNNWTALAMLANDFFFIKRWGVGHVPTNAVFVVLLVVFLGLAVLGARRKHSGWTLLGCWGGVAVVQTATGFLQFTAYQREGWSLLIAVGCLGGAMVSWAMTAFPRLRPVVWAGLAVSAVWAFGNPPAHRLSNSTAEDAMIRIARMFRAYPELRPDADPLAEEVQEFLNRHLIPGAQISLITRPLMQELMLKSVAGPQDFISYSWRDIWRVYDLWLERSTQALVFLDREDDLDVADLGSFAAISAAGAQSFLQQQRRSYALNRDIEAYVQRLPTNRWRVACHDVTPQLRLYYVSHQPQPAAPE